MGINSYIIELIDYAISKKLVQIEDFEYCHNRLTEILKVDTTDINMTYIKGQKQLSIILDLILDYSFDIGLFSPNSIIQRDLYESKIMNVFSSLPSDVNHKFHTLYKESPTKATEYFYKLSEDNNYIKKNRISNNINWKSITNYGEMSFTINLSKPEKDPRDIIMQSKQISTDYPKCVLCKENVGFYGNTSKPGRSNHRIIKLNLNDEIFYLQYSPYVYYNEHSIVLLDEHIPMKVSSNTFKRLFDFVDMFPHYFLGSNAGLPIVGGSILNHEHYQGGKHHFPIEDAKIKKTYDLGKIKLQNLIWPISVIRLESKSKEKIIETGNKIFEFWENYSNSDAGIYSQTSEKHNAITPIARKINDVYYLDIALRNNLTSEKHPLGVFHTHNENQHIKKENIGLIEVMGLAVLPARLKTELETIKNCIINDNELPENLGVHSQWFKALKQKYVDQDINKFIEKEVADVFVASLQNAAVFKETEEGFKHLSIFMDQLINFIENN